MKAEPQRQARLSYLEVQTVIQQLQEQGWKDPSIRQIYTALNCRGSFRTLTKLKRQVLSQASPLEDNIVTKIATNQRNSLDNILGNVTNSIDNLVTSIDNKLDNLPRHLDNTLAHLADQLWERLQTQLEDRRSQLDSLENEFQLALNEMRELWLAAVSQYTQVKEQLQREQQEYQTAHQQLEELLLENQELKSEVKAFQRERVPTGVISKADPTSLDPLEQYFQTLTQLQNLNSSQKYDYAMKLFEQGLSTSEVSRILKVNKGTLQHYKDGKRQRPKEIEPQIDTVKRS